MVSCFFTMVGFVSITILVDFFASGIIVWLGPIWMDPSRVGNPTMIKLVCPGKTVESGQPELKKIKNKRKRGAYDEEEETPRQWPNGHGRGGGEAMPVRNGAP